MPASSFLSHIKESIHGAGSVVKSGVKILIKDPHILIYPYLALIFILVTSPIVSKFVIGLWRQGEQPVVLDEVSRSSSNVWLAHFGLVTFSVFYTIFVTAFFVCAISAATISRLDGRSTSPLYGLGVVLRDFFRIARFALLAIFFFPLGVIAQRHKFRSVRGVLEAVISSFSLSMSQLAPAVIKGHSGIFSTISHSVDTLGHFWKESIVIRLGTFLAILILGSISFLPKLIENYWFDTSTAHIIGWIATVLLGVSSYVVLKVISTVFTTVLYRRAEIQRKRR